MVFVVKVRRVEKGRGLRDRPFWRKEKENFKKLEERQNKVHKKDTVGGCSTVTSMHFHLSFHLAHYGIFT